MEETEQIRGEYWCQYFGVQQTFPIRDQTQNGWRELMVIMIQHMNQGVRGFAYNPHSRYSAPFTIISQAREIFTSKPITTPCVYEVYCPYSCKKIKIGLSKDKKIEALEFNTTTNRTVSFYADDNIRYLVNKHKPNKKDKKTIAGNGWSCSVEVEDKGNIAIFNPYCIDPLNPLSFFTFSKIFPVPLPSANLIYSPKAQRDSLKLVLGNRTVYLSPDRKYIGHNTYFDEKSSERVTITNPSNKGQEMTIQTGQIFTITTNLLSHYYGELQKIFELQNKQLEFNQQFLPSANVDALYEQISLNLKILEQIRARLMNDSCYESYQKLFTEHPRLYSAFARLSSFLNYGNSKFSTVKLAELGFYNRSDMLQDLSYVELPDHQIPSIQEENANDQEQLRRKMFSFSRRVRNLPFPNVDLESFLSSLHCQETTSSQIQNYATLDPYIAFVDKQAKVSLWSCEMMIHKMIQFDFSKNYEEPLQVIPTTTVDKTLLQPGSNLQKQPSKSEQSKEGETQTRPKQQQGKQDEALLQTLQSMGYKTSLIKKALKQAKNEEIDVIIDLIQKMAVEAPKKKPTKQWSCIRCTFKNKANVAKCQICEQFPPDEEEDQQAFLKALEAENKRQEEKKRQEKQEEERNEQEKARQQELLKQKMQSQKQAQFKKCSVKSIAVHRTGSSNIDPFFISLLVELGNKFIVKTFRIGLNRASLLKFYRIEDELIVSNFNRQILSNKDFAAVNQLIGESRQQIQWGIKFFESSDANIWTVISSSKLELQGPATAIKYYKDHLQIFNNQTFLSYRLKLSDTLNHTNFVLEQSDFSEVQKLQISQPIHQIKPVDELGLPQNCGSQLIVGQKVEEVCIEVIQHIPSGQWKNLARNKEGKIGGSISGENLIMSEFLPLKIESYEGSIFSHKYSCTSMLQKSSDKSNIYVSNYPTVSFAFKSIDNKPMFIESATVISKNVKMNKIYPITSGLIFTANQLSWFAVAKQKFSNFTKAKYEQWLKLKQVSGQTVGYWEPVAYFDLVNQVEFEINFKRIAKYVYLLPTAVNSKSINDEVIAVKIDFFGVKGRVEEELPQAQIYQEYKNQGSLLSQLHVTQEQSDKEWTRLEQQNYSVKSTVAANTLSFAPKYFESYSEKIPLSITSIYKIKFKSLESRKKISIGSSNLKSYRTLSIKQATNTLQKFNVSSFAELIHVQNKLSSTQIQTILNRLQLVELILQVLKGPADITHYQNLFTKILGISGYDRKVLQVMSEILVRICDPDVVVTDIGFKSFMRFYDKIISLNQQLSKQTIQKSWMQVTQFCHKCRNKSYNILRNTYKIEELILEPGLFSKDYYRLINPSYVEEQKPLSITAEPQTPLNNRVFIDSLSDYNYVYYIDLLGHQGIQSIDFYFPKITGEQRYKLSLRLAELTDQNGQIVEKQVYYRYFHEDYLLQLSQKAFRDTEIFTKTQLNYCSIPGSLISGKARILKFYFNLLIITTVASPKFKPLGNPYIVIPVVTSAHKQQLKYEQNPLPPALQPLLADFPTETKHNSCSERMPPHRFTQQNKKFFYLVHELKNKANREQARTESINKIQKLVQNILDKAIVTETAASIKINDFMFNYKGLDFAYILIITLYKMFRKLPQDFKVDVKLMFTLFDAFIVYECGPIKNQTASILIELYNRLSHSDRNYFVEAIVDNYLIDTEKIRSLKISEKYPSEKIIKFLNELNLPIATLFQKLRTSKSLASITILIMLISNNKSNAPYENLHIYKDGEIIRTNSVHQLIEVAFKACNWIIGHTSGLSSEILELALNLLLSFFTQNANNTKSSPEETKKFIENMSQQDFWHLTFGILRKRNDVLNDKIDHIFKVLVENITEGFQKGINNMLLEIIRNDENSLYQKINRSVTDDVRMNHLKTILQYLSLTNKKIFLDTDTAVSLLQLPLTTTLWSLALKIIPREDKILIEIIRKFSQELYNSLGHQIMQFCEPLAGIRRLESNHINWLDLVKKIRIDGRSIFQLFIEHLKKCNFGGRSGLTMALPEDVVNLEIADEFAKLVAENKIEEKGFTEDSIRTLVGWFFMNYSKEKGSSPATDLLLNLSKSVLTIFQKVTQSPSIIPKFIKIVLETRKQGQILQNLFQHKRISSCNAIELNKRFSQCFELLINLLCINDELFNYFAFDIDGLQYILEKSGLSNLRQKQIKAIEGAHHVIATNIPQQEYLISQGLITSAVKDPNPAADKSSNSIQLKEEEVATNVQLVPLKNHHNITCTNVDWTIYKKANKTKIIFLPMNGPTHHEFPLYVSFANPCEVRSIKIGFPAASYEMNDKLVAAPSFVLLEGGMDLKNMQAMGEMEQIEDEGYTCNGVRVFVLNLQKIKGSKLNLGEAVSTLSCFRVKFLKIIVKRPVVSFIEGQYSPLNGKPYTNLGCSICFLSVVGDNFQKRKLTLLNFCKEISKSSALTILGTVINESNSQTVQRISHSQQFVWNFKNKFSVIQQQMTNYPNIVPNIVYSLGSSNEELGDWIISKFLSEGTGDIQAKLLNQIVMSSSSRIYIRLDIFLTHLMDRVKQIVSESDIQANVKYSESLYFVESFCKTLEESYDFCIEKNTTLHCSFENIEHIITLYDRKYSSPQIKTFSRLLINLLYLRSPISLSENVQERALNLIWQNCSEAKPYFYDLLGALLVNKKNKQWVQQNDHEKIKQLVTSIHKSIDSNSLKILSPQLFILWILSFHEKEYILRQKIHLHLYNKIKHLSLPNFDIFDYTTKLIQNVVLDNEEDQKQMAIQLIEDVDLLVKRKDQNLQQLYVGILRLEKQVYVNLKGFDVDSRNSKKDALLTSKILNKVHLKALSEKINKKIKFNLTFESDLKSKSDLYDKIYGAMNGSQFLLAIKLKLPNGKYGYVGCYCPGRSFRSEEDSYCWEDVINYEKGSFIFNISEGETKFIEGNPENSEQIISLFGGEDEMDQSLSLYDKNVEILKLPFNNSTQSTITIANLEGAKIESVQVFNGSVKPSTMEPKILASSSKAGNPFNFYRTSSIFIYPHRINMDKLMSIIGIKGKCKKNAKPIGNGEILGTLGEQSDDFIADITIQVEDAEDSTKQQQGYFPIMKIFDKFSDLGGVNKVLEIGSKSIKDWRKPERRKCFEHYMSELKNFVHLPNFFNHYIKNQQSITFLFEVASGMPDDPNSEKNWEQEEVKSSKFIYKILADIYKYDKSPELRSMDKYSQFCQLILQKLAEISKQTVRSCKENEVEATQAATTEAEKQKNTANTTQKKKKKGTGYSSDNQNSSKWTAGEWIEYRKNMNQEIQRVASIFVSFLDCQRPLTDPKLAEIIKNSCLLPLIESALRSGSLLDISKEADLFRSYLNIIKSMSSNPSTISCLLDIDPKYKPSQTESIFKLLGKLHGIAQIFIDCLKSGKTSHENEVAAIIATDIEKVYGLVDKAVKNSSKSSSSITMKQINSMPTNQAYRLLLGGLRFGYVDMKKKQEYSHFYATTIPKGTPPTAKILRLSQELADLSSSLPCEHTNSIFVRCDKSRIDVIKILIMGSKDTPYSNGAFMFDLFCDDSYPNNPPKMSITTTGGGKIRFNPNLYQCGKVCLSLLGTWRGQASENWDAKISTLLQLFISTQGITMSEDLYFNEPGFDSEQGTVEGQRKNEAYANIVKIGNVRYAMIDQIKNPPKGFEEVVNRHFYVKKKEILQEIQKWIQQADTKQASYVGLVNDHNTSWCTQMKPKGKYKQMLVKEYEELKTILANLPEPNLKQKEEEATVVESHKLKKKVKAKQMKLGEIDVSYDPQAEKELIYEENVMQDRWSRYIGAMGIEAVKKQAESKVILVGLKTLGLEIAKNLVLSGLKQLCIVANGEYDLGSEEHFYMSDVKSKKIEECVFKIKQLNPYMLVKCQKQMPPLQGYHLVVSTEPSKQTVELSIQCRKHNIKFIHALTSGVSGLYFADLGKQFTVEDSNGQQPFEGLIKQISCDKEGIVKLLDGIKHPYQDGDYVVLDKVEGMKQIESSMEEQSHAQTFYNKMSNQTKSNSINGKVFQIKVINWNSFSIGDTTKYGPYVKGGLCKNINIPKKLEYVPFEECVKEFDKYLDPALGIYDFEKMGDNYSVFACFQAYSEFIKKHNRKPKNWQLKDSEQFEQILKNFLVSAKKSQQEGQPVLKFGREFALVSQAQLPVIGAYFGGLISQEVIKAITNKYTPIKQFFTFHFNELMQAIPQDKATYGTLQVKENELFPNLKIVVGNDNFKKIEEMKTFVIGAGAIGCELLKNFAMLNMGAQGMITVTDPDHIETSNLTRQFLFRQKHVKKPKSATAAATLIQMNPLLKNHISARLDKVSEQSEQIYSDEFFQSQTVIANALDNVKARIYVDSRCVVNSKPLFESGTLGPKGHVQVIVPGKTENYGNQNDPTQQNQIPHCTLKMFPQETVHCIQWSRDIFGKVFTLNPKALKKVIEAKDASAAEGQEKTTVAKMIEYKPSNFDDCVGEAVRKFYKYFRNNVRQLLHTYPLDMKTKDGNLFWTLPKRPPKQINSIDFTDPIHQKFIVSYGVLLAKIYQLPYPKDFRSKEGIQAVMSIAKGVKAEEFTPTEEQSKKLQEMTEKQNKQQKTEQKQNLMEEKQAPLTEEPSKSQESPKIELTKELLEWDIKPQQFEKDEDSNGHIDLIFAMSNLRSRNYGLNECTWIEAKLKAGKIMAALSTTTSVVAALQTIQIVKLVIGSKQYRNGFINLAIPLIQISEPGEVPKHKIGNTEFSVWDTWQFKATTLKDLFKQIQDKYDVEGYNVSTVGGVPVYWQAMYVGKEEAAEEILNRPLEKILPDKTTLNILMRSKVDKKPFEHVPRVVIIPPQSPPQP